jgi:hypothetical protein
LSKASSLRVIVTGLAGLFPVGGVAWDYLQYIVGLSRLGHDVYYHEDTWSWPYHPLEKTNTSDARYSAAYIGAFFQSYAPELCDRWHYLHLHEKSFGMDRARFDEVARTADLFLNISGACMIPDGLCSRCVKVFLDTDPGYNQIVLSERLSWSENVDRWCASVAAHDRHFTYAENINGDDCRVPLAGYDWKTTRMPVVLELWEPVACAGATATASWTTVMTWNSFKGKLTYGGVEYGSKGRELERLIDLPLQVTAPLCVALGGKGAPQEAFKRGGWQVLDGPQVTLTPGKYRAFIAGSRGELSPAKHVYVAMRTGWFSCRSACYLAACRPVVLQDTGFSAVLPIGEGVVAFTNAAEAAAGICAVEADYRRHCEAARDLAGKYFDSDKVLATLLENAFAVPEGA